jgi:hypothetical protein
MGVAPPFDRRIISTRTSGILYGVRPPDPPIDGVVAALPLAIGLAASDLPARRANRPGGDVPAALRIPFCPATFLR